MISYGSVSKFSLKKYNSKSDTISQYLNKLIIRINIYLQQLMKRRMLHARTHARTRSVVKVTSDHSSNAVPPPPARTSTFALAEKICKLVQIGGIVMFNNLFYYKKIFSLIFA